MASIYSSDRSTRASLIADRGLWAGILVLVVVLIASVPVWGAVVVAISITLAIAWRDQNRRGALLKRLESIQVGARGEAARLNSELKSLQSQSRLGASALLQLIDGVIVLSSDLSILFINPSAVRFLGLESRESPINRSFAEVVRNPKMIHLIRLAIDEKQPQESVFEVHHGEGVLPLRIRVDVIDDGEMGKVQLSLRDETESRQLEGMRREFIANVSHELKTPLAAIKGYAETVQLAVADDPEMAIHFMNSIMGQCQRLERLISDMMQLARAQSGRAHLNVSSISLRDVVAESVRTYVPVADASGLKLRFHDEDQSAKVLADPEAALTIANNLIGNAIRYTPRGGCIDVSLRDGSMQDGSMQDGSMQDGPMRWSIVVADTGIGIAEKEQSRVFERFYRGSRSAEMATSSTGLGLAIVKNLAVALGGNVSVHSRLGEGSTFAVELPAVQPQGAAKVEPSTGAIAMANPPVAAESLLNSR